MPYEQASESLETLKQKMLFKLQAHVSVYIAQNYYIDGKLFEAAYYNILPTLAEMTRNSASHQLAWFLSLDLDALAQQRRGENGQGDRPTAGQKRITPKILFDMATGNRDVDPVVE